MIDSLNAWLAAGLTLTAIVGAVASWLKWLGPQRKARAEKRAERERDRVAQRDVLLGRDPVKDSITNEVIAPALPGIGKRMASQELESTRQSQQLTEITRALTTLAESHKHQLVQDARLDRHDSDLRDLRADVSRLDAAYVERIVTKAESAQAWRAVEAAHNATPDHIDADEG